jgi:hypothetical protein
MTSISHWLQAVVLSGKLAQDTFVLPQENKSCFKV